MNEPLPIRTQALWTLSKWQRLLFLGFTLFASVANAAISICVEDRDNEPYVIADHSGKLDRLVSAAATRIHQQVNYLPIPWKRCLAMVEQGAMDGAMALVWAEERRTRFSYPTTPDGKLNSQHRVWRADYVIIVHRDSTLEWDGQRFSQLQGGLSSPLGYVSSKLLKKMDAFAFDSPPDKGLLLVAKNRLPGYVIEKEIGLAAVKKLGVSDQVKLLPIPFMTEDWYLVLSNQFRSQSPDTAHALWRAVALEREQMQNRQP